MRRFVDVLSWTAYLLIPVRLDILIDGLPVGRLEVLAWLAVGWLAWRERRVRGAPFAAGLLLLKVACASGVPLEPGLRARYYANDGWHAPFERSVEFSRAPYTRVDRRLDFAPDAVEFPLSFFNDIERFNFYQPNQPERGKLAFSAVWEGSWWIEPADPVKTVYLDVADAFAQLSVDGQTIATASGGAAEQTVTLTPGWRRLEVRMASPYGSVRRLSAGERVGSQRRPFGDALVATSAVDDSRMRIWAIAGRVASALDVLLLGWLAFQWVRAIVRDAAALGSPGEAAAVRHHRLLALVSFIAIIDACIFAFPWATRLMLLGGGGDPLTYEFDARDILLNGPLMTVHAALGQGEPFYYQPLYPYFLAAMHAIFGEGMFGILLVQRLLVVVVVWAAAEAAVLLVAQDFSPARGRKAEALRDNHSPGESVWPTAAVLASVFAYAKIAPLADVLLSESLFLPLLALWMLAMVRVALEPSVGRAAGAGVLAGVTALARSTTVLAWMAVVPICWAAWRNRGPRLAFAAVLLLAACAVVSLATARNWVVANRFVPITSSLPVNLYMGNEPPPSVNVDAGLARRDKLYGRLGLALHTRIVIEYALSAPGQFAANLGRKALFTLGLFETFVPGRGYSFFLIAIWIAAASALVIAVPGPAPVRGLLFWMAATQFAVVVIFFPHVYGDRLIQPFYLLLIPNAAIAVHHWLNRAAHGRWETACAAI